MALRDDAASLLVCAVEGTALTLAEARFYKRLPVSGVTLFTRNVPAVQTELVELTSSLQRLRPAGDPPLIIAIDQEGGRVARLKAPFPNAGPALALAGGAADAPALEQVRRVAEDMGQRLRALGINVNFAPCCDVLTQPNNTAIGDRAFGIEPIPASKRASAFLGGLIAAGVEGCLKHFPGQGAASSDTHLGGAVIDRSLAELLETELVPFQALLGRASMVMISHCTYPQLAPEAASRSVWMMQGLLREQLGFTGVVVSDDMNMGAIPQEPAAWQDAIVQAVLAGADLLLVCRHLERYELAYAALTKAAEHSPVFRTRLEQAAQRVLSLRAKLR